MERIGDILQGIARGKGRGESGPLVLLHAVEGAPGERVAHVPISHELYEAWLKLNNAPFRPHQSLALATLRRGEPLALRGSSPAAAETARLLLYEALRATPGATALLLLPTIEAAQAQFSAFAPLNAVLSEPLPIALVDEGVRASALADRRLLITTPDVLHRRLLRHHSRAWRPFWAGLRLCCVAEAHAFSGVAGAHLAALLLRCARLRPASERPLQLVATLAAVGGAEAALESIWPQPWRLIPADDGEVPPATLAVWRGGADRLREAAALALALQRSGGYSVHISAAPAELGALRQFVGDESGATTIGAAPRPADVQILAGYPGSHAALHQALRAGVQGAVLVLGEQLAEYTLAQRAKSLLAEPAPIWLPAPANTYVFTQHLLCAASELPVTQREVDAWQAHEVVARLERHGRLLQLPDNEPAWQPCLPAEGAQPSDPYADFALSGAGVGAVRLRDERGGDLGQLDAASFDRWGFTGAALPPGRSRYRVVARDEDGLTLTLRPDGNGRRTYPLRRCAVAVREELGERNLRTGRRVAWGRVTVDEEVYGYREAAGSGAPAELALSPPLHTRWAAHALWFDVGDTLNGRGQLAGWSLAAALPLRALAAFTDAVPAYSVADKRLYLVDAQPGGSGLAGGAFERLEELLELAYDIAMDCAADTLLEPLARADKDWLLHLLRSEAPTLPPPALPQPAAPAAPEPVLPPIPVPLPAPQAPERAALPEQPAPVEPPAAALPPHDDVPAAPPLPEDSPEPTNGRSEAPRRQPPPARRGAQNRRQPTDKAVPPASNGQRPAPSQQRRTEPARSTGQPAARPPASPSAAPAPSRDEHLDPPAAPVVPVAQAPLFEAPAEHAAEPADPTPDATAMIARMRRLREERERRAGSTAPKPAPAHPSAPVESRFKPGEKVFCLPYGDGVVRESRVDDGQELLVVDFPDYGELTVDPAVSLVRSVAPPPGQDDDDVL